MDDTEATLIEQYVDDPAVTEHEQLLTLVEAVGEAAEAYGGDANRDGLTAALAEAQLAIKAIAALQESDVSEVAHQRLMERVRGAVDGAGDEAHSEDTATDDDALGAANTEWVFLENASGLLTALERDSLVVIDNADEQDKNSHTAYADDYIVPEKRLTTTPSTADDPPVDREYSFSFVWMHGDSIEDFLVERPQQTVDGEAQFRLGYPKQTVYDSERAASDL